MLDNTPIIDIIGDNGASPEGGLNGTFNELLSLNGELDIEAPEFMASRIDDLGGPVGFNRYAVGWAHALNTPDQWTKQVASNWGGTRNGTIVHWPEGIESKGEVRNQFHHVPPQLAGVPLHVRRTRPVPPATPVVKPAARRGIEPSRSACPAPAPSGRSTHVVTSSRRSES